MRETDAAVMAVAFGMLLPFAVAGGLWLLFRLQYMVPNFWDKLAGTIVLCLVLFGTGWLIHEV